MTVYKMILKPIHSQQCTITNAQKTKYWRKEFWSIFKGALSGLKQILAIELPLKMKTKSFCFILKAFVVLDKKAKVNFKVYEVTD